MLAKQIRGRLNGFSIWRVEKAWLFVPRKMGIVDTGHRRLYMSYEEMHQGDSLTPYMDVRMKPVRILFSQHEKEEWKADHLQRVMAK